MKNKLKRFLSGISAIAVTLTALPSIALPTVAENTVQDSLVLYGDINGDNVINSDDKTALSQAINNKTASTLKNADLNADGKVNNVDLLLLNKFISGEIKYFPVGDYYDANVSFITRSEWIHILVTTFNMSVEDTSTIEKYYTDLSENQYEDEIELAANFGVFPVEGNTFNPDSMVTREFAARTANFCVGYKNQTRANYADSDDISYVDDVAVSVEKGWFTLIDNQFRPDLYMKSNESASIMNDLSAAVSESVINENANQIIEYNDSVIQLDSTISAVQNENTVTINDENVVISDGDIFTVNIDGTEHLYKAQNVSLGNNGENIVEVENATLEEAMSEVDIQGYGEVDYDNIEYFGDDTDSAEPSSTNTRSTTNYANLPNVQYLSGEKSVNLNKTFNLNGVKVTLSGTLSNIRPEYKLQFDGNKVKSFYLNVNADANFTAKTSASLTGTKSREVPIASLPVPCGGGLTINIGVYATVTLSGEISLSYGCNLGGGVSYTQNGGWRTTKSFQKKGFTLDVKTSESVAIKAALEARFLGAIKLAEVYIQVGEKGIAEGKKREDGTECVTLKAYMFAEMGIKTIADKLFNKQLIDSWPFINESNSPVKFYKHWENDVLVSKCSYENSSSGSTGSSTKSKYYNYVEYSKYGTEFDDVISPSNSADSKSDGSVTQWQGNIVLSVDTVVYGDLHLSSSFYSLDLDGHTLTVYGDIFHTTGTITINNGTLNVYGSYIMQNAGETVYKSCYAELNMENKYDKVNISGNFTTHNLSSSYGVDLIYGTLAVGGNIWSDGGISASSSYGHKTILNGNGTQKVYTSSGYFNELEVINPSTRTIVYGGNLRVSELASDINIKSDDLYLYYVDLNQKNMTINGDVRAGDTIDINGGILTINGNILHKSGTITCNNGTLNVNGNYTMEVTTTNNVGETEYNVCSAGLKMGNKYDKVNISGNLTTHNLSSNNVNLVYGTLSVGGDIWSDGGILCHTNHKTVLNGDRIQKIYTSSGYFNELEVINPSTRTIVYGGELYIEKLASDINIESDDLYLYYFDLNQKNMTINGNVEAGRTIDINGGILTINGNILHKSGTITCNNGTLNVNGDYTMEVATKNNVGETEYKSCYAELNMENKYDKVNISGNFTTHNLSSNNNVNLVYGTLAVGGNIWSDGGISASFDDGHKTILNGDGTQKVYTSSGYFNELEVINPSTRTIVYGGNLRINKLASDINIKSDDLYLYCVDLNQKNMTINGDVRAGDTIDINGGILTINGNILHKSGTITCNNGTLNVNGNYTMEVTTTNNVGETEYNSCSAKLKMQDENDKVNISGNFTTHNLSLNYSVNLVYGTLTVGGDIWSDGGISCGSNHKTVLNGEEKQTVTLGSSNKFNILVLTKPMYNYAFNPGQCWNTLIQNTAPVTTPVTTITTTVATTTIKPVSTTVKTTSVPVTTVKPVTSTTIKSTTAPATTTVKPVTSTTRPTTSVTVTTTKPVTTVVTTTPTDNTGDLNNDGKVNVADLVLVQKYITKKSDDISKSADLNNDRIVNVFDVVILRRKILC